MKEDSYENNDKERDINNDNEIRNRKLQNKHDDTKIDKKQMISKSKYFRFAPERKLLPIFKFLPTLVSFLLITKFRINALLTVALTDVFIGFITPAVLFQGDAGAIFELFFVLLAYLKSAKYRIPLTLLIIFITNLLMKKQ